MLPLRLWIHFPPITRCTLYHVTIEVVNSLPTHSRVYSVPCYHLCCGKWLHNINGNMVQSTPCYGWEVNSQLQWYHGTEYTLLIHFPPIAGCTLYHVTIEVDNSLPTHSRCTLYHVTIEVVNSLPTHSRVYSVPCYHLCCEFTSHPLQSGELSTSMVTWHRVHPAMGGKWIVNFDGNMVQSTICYGWEVTSQHKW
jgi:hypothetical protein